MTQTQATTVVKRAPTAIGLKIKEKKIKERKPFKGRNYSRAETIRGNRYIEF